MREARESDANNLPSLAEDQARQVYGLYEASDTWRWSLFCPQRGDVVVAQIPKPLAPEEGVYAAFGILTRTMMSDGSLILAAKSLGSSEASTTVALSRAFNRRPGCIHICQGLDECHVDDEVVFHCRSCELADGENFSAP